MRAHCREFPVVKMAKVLGVSTSGYYAWLKRPESRRAQENRRLDALVRAEFEGSEKRSGSLKITEALVAKGENVRRKRVAKRMQVMGIRSKVGRKFRVTTDSKHSEPVAPNLLQRRFTVARPNQVWVTDITYLWTNAGWAYLTVFLDLYSRLVVGWAVSTSLSHEAVLKALWRAVGRRRPGPGLMVHSDRGIQYACAAFRDSLADLHFVQSMSRKGNCWDNAVAESFFRTLKTEWYYGTKLRDVNHARDELLEYIERFYNSNRLHATLGYLTPMGFEAKGAVKCA
jgi:putative transposase